MSQLSDENHSAELLPVVQSMDWTPKAEFSDLYFRGVGVEVLDSEVHIPSDASLDFNTYFGSFYEDYWVRHTTVKRVAIKLTFIGSLQVRVYRDTGRISGKLLQEHDLESPSETEAVLNIAAPSKQSGRIHFQIHGNGEGGRLSKAEYVALDAPKQREISLAVGICTFNREIQLMDNLNRLFSCDPALKFIKRVIIVNQGEPFSETAQQIIATSPVEVHVLEQENEGGTGGFIRTMKESAKTDDITHHILMDDDIELDPEVFPRTAQFLAFADKKVVIGGAAFNLEKPTLCYEAGAQIRPNGELRLFAHNKDMSTPESLSAFNNETDIPDYNAWWFSVIPIEAIKTVPRPLGLFIRWDDIEYGLSLGKNGFNTVCLPRVNVWHPPFGNAPEGWKTYYSIRNTLISTAIHTEKLKLPSSLKVFLWMADSIAKMDYQNAALIQNAIDDFTDGPEKLLSTPLQEIQDRVAKTAELSTVEILQTDAVKDQKPHTPAFTMRYIRVWLRNVLKAITTVVNIFRLQKIQPASSKVNLLEMKDWNVFATGASSYVLTNPERDFLWKYSPDPVISRQLLTSCWATAERYGNLKKDVSKQWNTAGNDRKV